MTDSEILFVDPQSPDQETISKAAGLIKNGGLVVFPTSSFYGLGTSAFNAKAVDRVFRVKKRDPKNPILILIGSLAELDHLAEAIPRPSRRLMEAFWPGSLTLVFHASAILPSNLTGNTGKVGIRLANHVAACGLVRAVGHPITGTSANISGQGGCNAVSQLDQHIRDQVDLILDAGSLPGGKGSTVVDVTVDPPKIIREGAIQAEEIHGVLGG